MRKLWIVFVTTIVLILSALPVLAADRPSSWAVAEVQTAIELGLVPAGLKGGYTKPITRAEFASLVMQLPRMENYAAEDMDESESLTRQQAAKMLYKACEVFAPWVINEDAMITTAYRGYASMEMPHSWEDGAEIRSDARAPVNWCYRHNVVNGMGGNTFAPEGGYTREQAILTVLRLYYTDGRASSNPVQNEPDYYPVYSDYTMSSLRGWIDSSLNPHTKEEIGHLADRDASIGFVIDNVGVGVTYGHLIDPQGRTLLTDLWGAEGKFHSAQIDEPYVWVALSDWTQSPEAPVYGVVDIETGQTWPNKTLEDVTGKTYPVQEHGPAQIVQIETGWYRLKDDEGKVLSETYENAMAYVGDDLYIGWVGENPRTYDVIRCDGLNPCQVVRTETFRFNNRVFDLGGGVYAVQNTDTQTSVFDAFGDTLSTISTTDAVVLAGSANGLLYFQSQGELGEVYYTQTGKALPPFRF